MNEKKFNISKFSSYFSSVKYCLNISEPKILELLTRKDNSEDMPRLIITLRSLYKELISSESYSCNDRIKVLNKLAEAGFLEGYLKTIELIIARRKEKSITMQELSKMTNVSYVTIASIENLQTIPTFLTILKICKTLGINIHIDDYLYYF